MTHKTTHIMCILGDEFDTQKTFRQEFSCILYQFYFLSVYFFYHPNFFSLNVILNIRFNIYILHYAFPKILNVFGSSPKKLIVVLYVFVYIDGKQTHKIAFKVNSNDELCVDLLRVCRHIGFMHKLHETILFPKQRHV